MLMKKVLMSNFWDKRGITAPQIPATVQQPQPATTNIWWASTQSEAPQQWQPLGHVQQPQAQVQPVFQPEQEYTPTRHLEAEKAGHCPECGGSNYLTMHGDVRQNASTARCFDCGYPVKQSSSGDFTRTVRGGQGPRIRAAKQFDSGGYHPEIIVGSLS